MLRLLNFSFLFFVLPTIAICGVMSVESHNDMGITFRVNINEMLSDVAGDYATISLPDEVGISREIGKPVLPVIRRLVRIPASGDVDVEIEVHSTNSILLMTHGLPPRIIPRQPPRPKSRADFEFVIDERWYADSSVNLSHNDAIRLSVVGRIRGRRIALLEIFPVLFYSPQLGIVNYISSADVHISFEHPMEQLPARMRSFVFNELLSRVLPVPAEIPPVPELPIIFWIIYADDFAEQIAPFIDWKEQMGYDVFATPISAIGASVEAIRDTVQNAYDGWENPPDFVLLVGDEEQIPAEEIVSGWDLHFTDLYYFTTDGDDFLPDILYGRFPCASAEQVEALVEKTILHEKFLMSDMAYLRVPVFIACGTDGDYELAESTHRYVFTTWTTPPEFQPESLWAFDGADGSDVINAINEGAFIVDYSGHGSTTGWGNPSMSNYDVYELTNSEKYPLVISNACLTGSFNIDECFGEAWVRAPEKGAVAFIGASNSTYWDEDDIWERRWFDAVFADSFTSISGATYKANVELMLWGTDSDRYYFEVYQNFGDPSLWLYWGEPTPITVDLSDWDGYIPIGEDYYDIPVSDDDVLVSLWRDGNPIGSALSDGGVAHIIPEFSPSEPGSVLVVATKPNFFSPHIQLVPNEYLCIAEFSPESLQVGVDNTFEITLTSADSTPYDSATVKISGYGLAESTFTDSSGVASMIVNPPYEGTLTLIAKYDGRRILRKDIFAYGALSWEITTSEIAVEPILLNDTLAVGFPGSIKYWLSQPEFVCYIDGGGFELDSISSDADSIAIDIVPEDDEPLIFNFAKHGYVILVDTIPVVVARGEFFGSILDTTGATVATRPFVSLIHDDDTISTVRAEWDGTFLIPGTFLCDTYSVTITAFGYYDTSYTFLLTARGGYNFVLTPTPSSSISVSVHDSVGTPLTAEVHLFASAVGEVVSAGEVTGIGEYSLGRQPYCDYVLIVRSRGYSPQRIAFTPSTEETDMDIILSRNEADILLIDASIDGASPEQIATDLVSAGFSVQMLDATPSFFPDTAQMWQYNAVIYSAGTNSSSATPSRLEKMMQFHNAGGRIIFEGGELAYQVIEEGGFSPTYVNNLLHLQAYISDNPGDDGLAITSYFTQSIFYSYPFFLPPNIATVHISFFDYDKFDVVKPYSDAEIFYATASDTSNGCIVLFRDLEQMAFARSAYCAFSYDEAFVSLDDAASLMANLVEDILPPYQDSAVVYGEITLAGGFLAANVEIEVAGPVSVIDSSNYDGRFAIATKPGEYLITFRREDYRDTTVSVSLNANVATFLEMILTPVEGVSERKPEQIYVGMPMPNPFNNAVAIVFDNPLRSKVMVEVRDISGRLIHTEKLGNVIAGEVLWRPDGAQSGIYFIKLMIADEVFVRKALYIR